MKILGNAMLWALGATIGFAPAAIAQGDPPPAACTCTLVQNLWPGSNYWIGSATSTGACSVQLSTSKCIVTGTITLNYQPVTGFTWMSGTWGMPVTALSSAPGTGNNFYAHSSPGNSANCGSEAPVFTWLDIEGSAQNERQFIDVTRSWTCDD